ncbi:Hypothetical predicted protein [Paramuricea clavata]|uniref:Uncharacterized protein n=1 Tax=Paramuricea clavata TaxID=317549 RepID=A0A6S7HJ26_PARCT|nr:Hypothetical predicted protein [Paramuricea clavata]
MEYRKCHHITAQNITDPQKSTKEEDLLDMMNFVQEDGCPKPALIIGFTPFKFVLRSEGSRDYCYLLRSLKLPPTINVSDIPNRLATFSNRVTPNFFAPNDGQLFSSAPENVTMNEGNTLINYRLLHEAHSEYNHVAQSTQIVLKNDGKMM